VTLADSITRADAAPFWHARLVQAGLAGRAEAPGALARLPLTRRHELLADQLAHLPYGSRRPPDARPPVRVGKCGTGDALLVLGFTADDLRRERAAGVALLRALGIAPRMRVANALPGALATPGSLLLGDVVEELGALDVPLGDAADAANAPAAWALVDRVQPDVLVLPAAGGAAFLAAAPAADRRWCRGLVWLVTDMPRPASPPPASSGLGAAWQRAWLAVPEATSFAGRTCAADRLHPARDVVAEVVYPPTGAPVTAGEAGELSLTPLGLDTPCLRYATGLRVRAAVAPCACGEPGVVLETAAC
jgi:phenylacetate-CoA ligase